MNFVEEHTWSNIERLLNELDPEHKGWCIDAGIGDGDYYFEWFSNMGHPTIAIEPLPTFNAREAVTRSGALLMEVALSDKDGSATLYTSNNIRSLVEGLWGEVLSSHPVQTGTLRSIVPDADNWAALKLDIEGSEGIVLRQLVPGRLPAVLSFEFGGVWNRLEGIGPWSPARALELWDSLRRLFVLGYTKAIIVSSGDTDKVKETDLPIIDFDALFTPDTNWGNIIVWGIS